FPHHLFDRGIDPGGIGNRVIGGEIRQRPRDLQDITAAYAAVEERHHRTAGHACELVGGGDGGGGHAEERHEHRVLAAHVLVWRVPEEATFLQMAHGGADVLVGEHRAGVLQTTALHRPFHHRIAVAAVHAGQRHVVAEQPAAHLQCHEVAGHQQHAAAFGL